MVTNWELFTRQLVATVIMMNSSMLLALTLFATLVTGNDGNLQDSKHWNNQTRDIKAFPACVTDSDCAAVTGLGGEVADFKCFQSMCFPWANRELQGEQVETISLIIFMLIITIAIVTVTTGMPWANKVVHTPSTRFQYFNEKPTSIWGWSIVVITQWKTSFNQDSQ